ncbi:MAG: formate dehydrogenase accessory sulfurtransferase FdhD [Crocinitomicaceae bacterium]
MEGINEYEGIKIEKGSVAKVVDPLTVEQALEIQINGKPFTVVMQTPGNEEELATGLLFAEDVIGKNTKLEFETFTNENGDTDRINLSIPENEIGDGYLSTRSLLSVSSCGICGKQSLDDLPAPKATEKSFNTGSNLDSFVVSDLLNMQLKMVTVQENFKQTGGCHGVAAFTKGGELLIIKEDIGRHNAMDKVIGDLIKKKELSNAQIIMFSGRISYEIVSKAFRARIPLIMAVSAPSTLAIDFAKEYGITLLGFARNGKFTCYSNCNRIQIEQ